MDQPATIERERALARVRALAAKTTANGCTEAEAQAATAALNRLLEAYELTLDETAVRNSKIVERIIADKRSSLATHATWGISEFASTSFVFDNDDVHIFGSAPNTEIAEYLFVLCAHAIDRETEALSAEVNADDRITFGLGMAHRLSNRLVDMAKARAQLVHSVTGTDLVVLGRAAAIAAVRERYGQLTWVDRDDTERRRKADIYQVGWDVAGSVAINEALEADHGAHVQIEDKACRQQQEEEEILKKAEKLLLERWRKGQEEAARQATAEAEERLRRTEEEAAARAASAAAKERRRKAEQVASTQRLREFIDAKLQEDELKQAEKQEDSRRHMKAVTRAVAAYYIILFAIILGGGLLMAWW